MPGKTLPPPAAQSLIDVHCHRFSDPGHLQIRSLDVHELASESIEALGQQDGFSTNTLYLSLGIHPWFIERQNIEAAFRSLEAFIRDPKLLAIGECGLDKCIDTPMSEQTEIFSRQIQLSEASGKPLMVHCVRAFAELLQLKKLLAPKSCWIIHGFTGKPALAVQLIQHGCYLSFGKALLQTDSQSSMALHAVPLDRLFLETDAADVSIDTIYATAAKIRGIAPMDLRRQLHSNFLTVFFND